MTEEVATIEPAALPALAEPARVQVVSRADALLPAPWEALERAAQMIATAPGLAAQFRRPEACMFIAYQAARWGADPVAVASKTYFTGDGDKERIGYEAQLVHALVESDPELAEPLRFEFGYSHPTQKTAPFRFCKVVGKIRGASKPLTLTTPTVGQIKVKRSPLWYADPDQQLSYYGARAWARRYRPGRILGIYSADELADVAREQLRERPEGMFEDEDGDEAQFDGVPPDEAPPATGDDGGEPADIGPIREWLAGEQARLLKIDDAARLKVEWNALIKDKRWNRFKAYASEQASAVFGSVSGRIAELSKPQTDQSET